MALKMTKPCGCEVGTECYCWVSEPEKILKEIDYNDFENFKIYKYLSKPENIYMIFNKADNNFYFILSEKQYLSNDSSFDFKLSRVMKNIDIDKIEELQEPLYVKGCGCLLNYNCRCINFHFRKIEDGKYIDNKIYDYLLPSGNIVKLHYLDHRMGFVDKKIDMSLYFELRDSYPFDPSKVLQESEGPEINEMKLVEYHSYECILPDGEKVNFVYLNNSFQFCGKQYKKGHFGKYLEVVKDLGVIPYK